jgi:prevent-host-death family protein
MCYQTEEQISELAVETFSIRDLRERTGELVRHAEEGRLSLVAKHGRPLFVAVPMDEHLLAYGVNVALAARLFAEEVVTLSKGAKLAGLSIEAFIERLGAMGIPAVDYPPEEVDKELAALQTKRR